MSRNNARKIEVFAVIRYDLDAGRPEFAVNVKEVLPSLAEAEIEVTRLNVENADKRCQYFVVTTRFFPEGLGSSN